MNVGSLFSGIGGIDLGLERAGMHVSWQCEIDPWCRRVLAKHWPSTHRYTDIRSIRSPTARVDVLAGGFPCQPVSLAGRGLAQADERWLWPEFARVIRLLRPRYVLVENVPGLLTRGMADVLSDLAEIGYDAEWDSIGAVDLGAPHRRKRVWIVAYPAGGGREWWQERDCGAERSGGDRSLDQDATPAVWREGIGQSTDCSRGGTPGAMADASRLRSRQPRVGVVDGGSGGGGAERQRAVGAEALADPEVVTERAGLRPGGPRIFGRGRLGDLDSAGDAWVAEPDVGRVAHGVPARVDRLRGLGNAVVPQVVEWIGRRMIEAA